MKRPLIAVALLYVLGILLAALPIPLTFLFAASFTVVLLFFIFPKARSVLLVLLVVLFGWTNLAQRKAILSPYDLRAILTDSQIGATIRGTLAKTPAHRQHRDPVTQDFYWSSVVEIDVTQIRPDGRDWQPATGRLTASAGDMPTNFFAGQTIEVAGVVQPPPGPIAEGLFDYQSYLASQGIYYELAHAKIGDFHILASPPLPPLSDRFSAWARKTLALGLPDEDQTLQLEWALTLGWKAALREDVVEPFMRSSTFHIFAVDGLRIAIIAGILLGLFRAVGIPRALCGLLAAPLILFYAAMTGWPASAIRAIVMIFVIFGGWALNRPSDLLNSLFAAALIILVWEPRQLFQSGFQLSFFVVLCIVLILPFFNSLGERLLAPDPLLPEALRPRWNKILHPPVRYVTDLFLTSTAAWLGSIPLVAYYFHLVTPWSGLANVIAVPLCALVLVSNLSSLLVAAWLPSVAVLFNHAGWFLMECTRVTSNWSAKWPGAWFYLPMPGLFTIGVYYFLLIAALTGWLFRGRHRRWKISAAVLLLAVWGGLSLHELPVTRLTVLPLNGGYSVYLEPPLSRNDWLIDCGDAAAAGNVLQPFLRAQGVNRLSNFLLTHGEIAFTGGAQIIDETLNPKNVHLSPLRFRSPQYNKFETSLDQHPAARKTVHAGDQLGPFTVLYPGADIQFPKADDNAIVLRADLNQTRVLLLSDLGRSGQNALLNSCTDTNTLRADIVITGLPGDTEPLSDALLDAIQPRLIIVADSDDPVQRKANAALKQRLAQRNVPVLYTSETRAVTLAIRPRHWQTRAMNHITVSGNTNSAR